MSIIQQAKRPISFPSLALRLQLAVSAAGLVAMSGCVAVDQPAAKRPMPPGANTMAKPSTELMQRPPAEVRMSAEQMTEPTIQKGTGRFIDTSAQLSRTGKGNYVVKLNAVPVADAVQQVLGDTLGLSYVVEGEIAGAISVDTARPVDQRTLLEMLSGALAGSVAALINEGGFYRVTTAEAALASTSRIVGYGSSVSDLKVVRACRWCRFVSSRRPRWKRSSSRSLPKAPSPVSMLPTQPSHHQVRTRAAPPAFWKWWTCSTSTTWPACRFALLPVKNTSATGLVTELDQLFGAASGTPMAGLVRFIPIERLNAVMAISPQPQQLEQVQTWMERLDRSGRLSDQSFHVVPLQNRAAKRWPSCFSAHCRIIRRSSPTIRCLPTRSVRI